MARQDTLPSQLPSCASQVSSVIYPMAETDIYCIIGVANRRAGVGQSPRGILLPAGQRDAAIQQFARPRNSLRSRNTGTQSSRNDGGLEVPVVTHEVPQHFEDAA